MPLLCCNKAKTFFVGRTLGRILFIILLGASQPTHSQNIQGTLEKLPTQKGCEGTRATLDVSSERMTFDSKNRAFIFEQNVHVRRCAMLITCNHLRVIRSENGSTIERIIATDNVHFQQGTHSGVAEQADYFESEQKLVLTGNPRIWDTEKNNELRGEEMVFMLQEEKVIVKQAHVFFHPSKTKPKAP